MNGQKPVPQTGASTNSATAAITRHSGSFLHCIAKHGGATDNRNPPSALQGRRASPQHYGPNYDWCPRGESNPQASRRQLLRLLWLPISPLGHGVHGETRTPDLILRRDALHPSELRGHVWWARLGSNQRSHPYEGSALTTELRARQTTKQLGPAGRTRTCVPVPSPSPFAGVLPHK